MDPGANHRAALGGVTQSLWDQFTDRCEQNGRIHLLRWCLVGAACPARAELKGEILPVPLLGSSTFGPPLRLNPGETRQDFLVRARDALVTLGGQP